MHPLNLNRNLTPPPATGERGEIKITIKIKIKTGSGWL